MISICWESDDMDTSCHVSPGDVWHPESASRFNRVSDMLNRIGILGPSVPGSAGGGIVSITCINTGRKKIKANTYVTVGQPVSFSGTDGFSGHCSMSPGLADPCGIVMSDCDPGAVAEVQLSGLAEAFPPHPGNIYRITGSGSASGMDLVIINSTGCYSYNNYFKVTPYEWDDDGKIKHVLISDGGDPSSAYCGMTDVSGFMNRTSRDVAGRYLFIKLVVKNHSNGYFKTIYDDFEWFGSGDTLPGENEPYVLLAEITADGTGVIQRWTGGKIYWRNRFIIPTKMAVSPEEEQEK